MDESRLELKVGALVLAAAGGAFALLVMMGEVSFGAASPVVVNFAHTGNVVKHAPVKLGGVVVGKVDEVGLVPERRDADGTPLPVKMTLALSKDASRVLRADAAVTVSSVGPLGESYLELWPGSASAPLPPGAELRGTDSPRLDVVSNRLSKFLDAASRVLEQDPEALTKLVRGVGELSHSVDGLVTDNRDAVRQLAAELLATAKELRALSATARGQLEPGGKASAFLEDAAAAARQVRADLPGLSSQAKVSLDGLARVAGQLSEEDGRRLKALVQRAEAASERLDAIAGRADRLLARLEAGEGSAGKALKDPQVYDELKTFLTDVRKNPWKLLWKE